LSASSAVAPRAIRSSPLGPNEVFAEACVATAPTPAFAHGTTVPTAKNRLATATPTSPVAGSAAAIENVAGSGGAPGRAGAETSARDRRIAAGRRAERMRDLVRRV
jgi:hypothetical protein